MIVRAAFNWITKRNKFYFYVPTHCTKFSEISHSRKTKLSFTITSEHLEQKLRSRMCQSECKWWPMGNVLIGVVLNMMPVRRWLGLDNKRPVASRSGQDHPPWPRRSVNSILLCNLYRIYWGARIIDWRSFRPNKNTICNNFNHHQINVNSDISEFTFTRFSHIINFNLMKYTMYTRTDT